ncbi:MAG: Ppx/GppA family phosphatase [Firmicutes bacterium]|jgi:exopolyphosphatase/guanosine-5'-triphosphate,3'-diphosphate pyrophosphatase|nr:Ppx/GppA family phosphatase [Bacillota bacterium]
MQQRLAAIDIGSNSTRLLVAEAKGSVLVPIYQDQITTRLGQGSGGDSRRLLASAMERTAAAVAKFYRQAQDLGAQVVRLFGTSALREADNQEEFRLLVESKVGLKPEVLSGTKEAYLTYIGAVRALSLTQPAVIIDVGGGSTEIIWGRQYQVLSAVSLKLGAVRLAEKYLLSDPPTAAEWDEMTEFIWTQLKEKLELLKGKVSQVVAVGGTATTIAAMEQGLACYDRSKVQGYVVLRQRLANLVQAVRLLPVAERRKLPGLQPERADIIPAGMAILNLALTILDLPGFTVSDADLLLGSLYDFGFNTPAKKLLS